jgi:hypothetical protein
MRTKPWNSPAVFVILALLGLVGIINAVVASSGDLFAQIPVRGVGENTVMALPVAAMGAILVVLGVVGFLWRRE